MTSRRFVIVDGLVRVSVVLDRSLLRELADLVIECDQGSTSLLPNVIPVVGIQIREAPAQGGVLKHFIDASTRLRCSWKSRSKRCGAVPVNVIELEREFVHKPADADGCQILNLSS